MKGKAIIPLALGLGVGLLAVKFLMDTLKKAQADNANSTKIMLVTARVDIDPQAEITPDMIQLVETTDETLVPLSERLDSEELVVGRVTAKAIPQYSPVMESMLAPEGTPPGLTGRIPEGFRAVSVKIDEVSAVAFQLRPGDWVDVYVVMDIDTGRTKGRKALISEVILQRLEVAAIGRSTTGTPETTSTKVKPAKSVTLLVPEADVPKLHLAQTRGKITLAMRGAEDTAIIQPKVALGNNFLGSLLAGFNKQDAPPPVAKKPTIVDQLVYREPVEEDPPYNVMVFRGVPGGKPSIESITFENHTSHKIIEVSDGLPTRSASQMMSKPRGVQNQGTARNVMQSGGSVNNGN